MDSLTGAGIAGDARLLVDDIKNSELPEFKAVTEGQLLNNLAQEGLDDFFVALKSPRLPSVQKNHKFTVGRDYVDFMGWKPGAKLDILTDADQGKIVITLKPKA